MPRPAVRAPVQAALRRAVDFAAIFLAGAFLAAALMIFFFAEIGAVFFAAIGAEVLRADETVAARDVVFAFTAALAIVISPSEVRISSNNFSMCKII